MKISDGIRKWCDEANYIDKDERDELRELADRIDNEMVELPKDRDGVPIHEGDKMYLDDGRMFVVNCIKFVDNYNPFFYLTDVNRAAYIPTELTHTRPDSLERIADELDEWRVAASEDCRIKAIDEDTVHDFADRIRKLAERGER